MPNVVVPEKLAKVRVDLFERRWFQEKDWPLLDMQLH